MKYSHWVVKVRHTESWAYALKDWMIVNSHIHDLVIQISTLQEELRTAIAEQQANITFHIKGKRIEFERSVKQVHKRVKRGFFHWLITNRPFNLITGPVIYSMIIPMLVLDIFVSIYQAICFPIYRVPKVERAAYMVFDRHHLGYLNWIEKFHCSYCAYATGLIAYVTEITGRTEQYFCPIKHAHKLLGTHQYYRNFLEFGDAENYHERLEQLRIALEKIRAL